MADRSALLHTLQGRTGELLPTVTVTLASAPGQRDVEVTVVDSLGAAMAGVAVSITATSTVALGALVATALVGSLDLSAVGLNGADAAVLLHGRTNASGVFTVRLTLALLVLQGTVVARCGGQIGTVAGA